MFSAIRVLCSTRDKKPLQIDTGDGMTTDPKVQAKIVADYFEQMFCKENVTHLPNIQPTMMDEPFTEEEIKSAAAALKNNKSAGCDALRAEQIKYGPAMVYEKIADILNLVARTGTYPEEIKQGILVPLQKPGKSKGSPSNLRPVILLSILRKIIAICMIRRIGPKIEEHIPTSQAAYRPGRSTTEQIFTLKILAERAITSTNFNTHILLMDMSKAFDTIHRGTLLEDLRSILKDDELHMIKILIEDVRLTVRIGGSSSHTFTTNIGTPQGDCMSPVLFTLYLAQALKAAPTKPGLPHELHDHTYSNVTDLGTMISLQYADDICWVGCDCSHGIDRVKLAIPEALRERNLMINQAKTEEYVVNRTELEWKNCKYLGSLLDSEEDLKRRKMLARVSFGTLEKVLMDKHLHLDLKLRILNALVSPVFLYNCELWTMTKTFMPAIDVFQRNLLRKILNIHWPRKISNEELYKITNQKPWSETIKTRRLRWLGHLIRLPDEAPVKQALDVTLHTKVKQPRGAPKKTWIKVVQDDLKTVDLTLKQAVDVANDRVMWQKYVHMSKNG